MTKYRNKPIEADGYKFDSQAEHRRYEELKLAQVCGEIMNLEVHPRVTLQEGFIYHGKKIRAITYTADFGYHELKDGKYRPVIEDVKGMRTQVFNLKWKLAKAKCPWVHWRVVKV